MNVNTKEINQKRKMLEQKLEENTLAMKKILKSKYILHILCKFLVQKKKLNMLYVH